MAEKLFLRGEWRNEMVIQELFAVDSVISAGIVVLFLIMVYAMNHLPKKKFSFASRVLIGTGCGTVFGLAVYGLGAAHNIWFHHSYL